MTARRGFALLATSLLLLAGASGTRAQHSLSFSRYTAGDGLSHSTVRAITMDQHGFAWIATSHGVTRFDGIRMTAYTGDAEVSAQLLNADGSAGVIVGDAASGILTDRAGRIWIGTTRGLSRIDPDTRRVDSFPRTFRNGVVSLAEDEEGGIWVAGWNEGLFRLDRSSGNFEPIDLPLEPQDGALVVTGVLADPDGQVWVATYSGLFAVDAKTRQVIAYRSDSNGRRSLTSDRVRALSIDASGGIWIGYDVGLDHLDRTSGEVNHVDLGRFSRSSVNAIAVFDDAIWVALDEGLLRYAPADGTSQAFIHDPLDATSIGLGRVFCVAAGPGNSLFVGTDRSGLSISSVSESGIIQKRLTTTFPQTPLGQVSAFVEEPGGSVLAAGERHLVRYHPQTGQVESLAGVAELTGGSSINTMMRTSAGVLWAATEGGGAGILDVRRKTFRVVPVEGRGAQFAYALAEDLDGTIWVGSFGGLYHVAPDATLLETFVSDPADPLSLSDNWVSVVRIDLQGNLWAATSAGLDRVDRVEKTVERFGFGRDITVSDFSPISALRIDLLDNAWLTLAGAGLIRIETGTGAASYFTDQDGTIPTDHLSALEIDGNGHPWLQTSAGFFRFDPDTGPVARYRADVGVMPSDQALNPSIRLSDGSMMFGGTAGFFWLDPSALATPGPAVETRLAAVIVDQLPITIGQTDGSVTRLRLSHRQFPVTFEFSPLKYPVPNSLTVRYRDLEGDGVWHAVPGRSAVTFGSLSAGLHRIEAVFDYADGTVASGHLLEVVVQPVWWRTGWFVGLILILAVASVVAGFRARVRAVHLENERLERIVGERTAELMASKVDLEDRNLRLADVDAMKTRFFTNISHEFRTPLTLILGPLEDGIRSGSRLSTDSIGRMHRNGIRLLRLINQMLELSRLEAGSEHLNLGRYDLDGFTRRLVAAFIDLAGRRDIRLEYDGLDTPISFVFDPERLEKVVLNLLSNAIKFTPAGKGITVTLRRSDSGGVQLAVKDEGTGISEGHLPRLFDRYYQAFQQGLRRHEGTGIGLALVRELVALHEGTISVESRVNEGTTFTIFVPDLSDRLGDALADGPADIDPGREIAVADLVDAEDADIDPVPGQDASYGKEVVLIAEDNADLRAYMREQLEVDFLVLEAADGADGLRAAMESVPDLVVSDVMMPEMDGLEMLAALRADIRTSHIPVILLTAKADVESTVRGYKVGADAYVAKPFNAKILMAQATALIGQRRALRERYSKSIGVLEPKDLGLPSMDSAFLEQVSRATESRMGDADLTVEQLADTVGMSKRQLTRKLVALLDESPGALIRRMRMTRAAQLLGSQAMSIKEVSAAVGYRSESHFSQAFKEFHGVLPGSYSG